MQNAEWPDDGVLILHSSFCILHSEPIMPVQITMPQLSDTMTEGTVVKWHKKEGDKVKQGEELVDVETDKATMPFEAAESGTLAHVAVREGEKVPVGALIAVLATSRENPADVKKGVRAKGGAAA